MRTLATVNQKGGSGKTTTAVNLAAALGESGRRILVIDLDPQASASRWLGTGDGGQALFDVLTSKASLGANVRNTAVSGVDLMPSSGVWLSAADHSLVGKVGAEGILRRQVAQLPARWDYLVIDCPPALSSLTVNALTAVDELLVPVEAHCMALDGLADLIRTVEMVRERTNPGLRIAGILACRVDGRTRHAADVVKELRDRFGDLVHNTVIRENVRIAEAPSFSQPITRYDPRCAAAWDYRALARELIEHEGDTDADPPAQHSRQ